MKAIRPRGPEEIRQTAKHVLFAEGKGEEALDPKILEILFLNRIRVLPLGASFHVRSVAEALHGNHPFYYFLIDRDHHEASLVEQCWEKFPDPSTSNLLIWRRRELENYFLIPDYLMHSQWVTVSPDELLDRIVRAFARRMYIEAANLVIIKIREQLKANWIETFKRVSDFRSRTAAIAMLLGCPQFSRQKRRVSVALGKPRLTSMFDSILSELTGGGNQLRFGQGQWFELMRGKKVLQAVVQDCFRVQDRKGRSLQGPAKVLEVAKDLMRHPLNDQPMDFQQLYQLIDQRLRQS